MKVPFTLTDFSGGMKGKKGQLNSADIKHVQDLNNMLVERNNTLLQRNGVEALPITLLDNDKVLPFVHNGKKYYFIYDPLLKLNYIPNADSSSVSKSMGGMRHVDMFSKYNSSLSAKDYFKKEVLNHRDIMQSKDDTVYIGPVRNFDDTAKWAEFKNFDIVSGSYLDLHQTLRKLTWESSPTFVYTEKQIALSGTNVLRQVGNGHSVQENTFWWNRMFVLDEDFNIITTEIDMANFVTYDSEHTVLTAIQSIDTDVRDSTHDGLQTIRESRYGGSDLEYEAETMNQGVMFYNREGKLPNMFIQLNNQGQTDGVLRDFRTLYLDEVPNGIFKTAPYFTATEYASQQLFDEETMRLEMKYITEQWGLADNLLSEASYLQVIALLNTFYAENAVTDYALNPRVKFSYDVKDEANTSDVIKAFLPLTSDSSPSVEIDNIRFEEADGQVRFASPSLANFDRDFVFPHDGTSVWQNTDLASELPFVFSPNLVIYHNSFLAEPVTNAKIKYSSPILTLINNNSSLTTFALVPMAHYTGGAIGKFNDSGVAYRPERITALTSDLVSVVGDADYLPVVVYTQVFGLVKYNASMSLTATADATLFPVKLGYFTSAGVFYALKDFKTATTTYSGWASQSTSGFFSSSSSKSEYSFKVIAEAGGSIWSVLNTNTLQLSKANGFNADAYFSSVAEYASRIYLASKAAPNTLIFSSTNDYLDFSTISARVNSELVAAVTRGGRELFFNENIEALHESNGTLRVITDRRIVVAGSNEAGAIVLSNPSDIVTSGKEPVTINNFTYFVSGDNRDVLLSVFSDKTQRFEYYSVFSELNVDDETKILKLLPIDASYRMVVQTEEALYIGTIIAANQVAWSRLTFTFTIDGVSTTSDALYLKSGVNSYKVQFVDGVDLEAGVVASLKLLAPTAMANLVNVPKTNINYIGLRYHDVTLVGTLGSPTQSGSDARPIAASDQGDVVEVHNKNYNDIYDSIEISFEGGQNRLIYLRGSLGV